MAVGLALHADAFRLTGVASLAAKADKTDTAFRYRELPRSQGNTNGLGR